MKILVTGADGQLGSDVIKELKKRNIEYKGCIRKDFDINDYEKVKKIISDYSPDAIIHCAAYTNVEKAEDEKEKCFYVNAVATAWITMLCKEIDAKIMYISTDYVFSGRKEGAYTELDKAEPLNEYGLSKYLGEMFVSTISSKFFIVRVSWLYGINGRNFVKTMLELSQKEVNVVCDQKGSPTYTKDISELLIDMIMTEKYGIYNAANEGVCSWAEFAQEIFRLTGKEVKVNCVLSDSYRTKARRPLNSVLDKTKLSDNGFKRLPHWKDALERYIAEIKAVD